MGIVDARNQLAEYFLDKTDATHMWWIDTDMGFAPDTPQRLVKHGLDVVGARTYGHSPIAPDGLGGWITRSYLVAYDLHQQADGFLHYTPIDEDDIGESKKEVNDVPTDKTEVTTEKTLPNENEDEDDEPNLIKVAATGTGCLLVSRNALEKIRDVYDGNVWFDQVSYPKREGDKNQIRISEDMSFCYRLGTVGIPVYIDLSVRTNHMKTVWVGAK